MARSGRGRRPGSKGRARASRPVERTADGPGTGGAGPGTDAGRTADLGRVGDATGGPGADAGTPAGLDPVGDTAGNSGADPGAVDDSGAGGEAGTADGPAGFAGVGAGGGPTPAGDDGRGGSAPSDAGSDTNVGAGAPPAAPAPAATAPTHTVLLPSATGDNGASPRAWQPESTRCPVCRIPPAPGATTCPDCREDLAPLLFLRARADRGYNAALADAADGRHAAALDGLRWVLADNARHVPALVLLGKVHAQLGADADARAAWLRALRLAPGHETAAACLTALPADKPTSDG